MRFLDGFLIFICAATFLLGQDPELVKRAEAGDADAQVNLGLMYANGEGVPKDYSEAMKWFRLAADQGDSDAQCSLGLLFAKGQGVPKDLVEAHVWFNITGMKGNETAKNNLRILEKKITSKQKTEAIKLARELFAILPKG